MKLTAPLWASIIIIIIIRRVLPTRRARKTSSYDGGLEDISYTFSTIYPRRLFAHVTRSSFNTTDKKVCHPTTTINILFVVVAVVGGGSKGFPTSPLSGS